MIFDFKKISLTFDKGRELARLQEDDETVAVSMTTGTTHQEHWRRN